MYLFERIRLSDEASDRLVAHKRSDGLFSETVFRLGGERSVFDDTAVVREAGRNTGPLTILPVDSTTMAIGLRTVTSLPG